MKCSQVSAGRSPMQVTIQNYRLYFSVFLVLMPYFQLGNKENCLLLCWGPCTVPVEVSWGLEASPAETGHFGLSFLPLSMRKALQMPSCVQANSWDSRSSNVRLYHLVTCCVDVGSCHIWHLPSCKHLGSSEGLQNCKLRDYKPCTGFAEGSHFKCASSLPPLQAGVQTASSF